MKGRCARQPGRGPQKKGGVKGGERKKRKFETSKKQKIPAPCAISGGAGFFVPGGRFQNPW